MSENELGTYSTPGSQAIPSKIPGSDVPRPDAARVTVQSADALAQFEREQLARDYADIERAAAALQQAQPALQSWIKSGPPAARQPRPLWLLIGVLWLSTALVTAGAVAVIASLAG